MAKIQVAVTASKIVLVVLLIGCLFKMPYTYYTLVRIAMCIGCWWIIYDWWVEKHPYFKTLLMSTIILFNPLLPIHLSRLTWSVIDIIIALTLLLSVINDIMRRPQWS